MFDYDEEIPLEEWEDDLYDALEGPSPTTRYYVPEWDSMVEVQTLP